MGTVISADISSVAPGVCHMVMEKVWYTITAGMKATGYPQKMHGPEKLKVSLNEIPSSLTGLIYKCLHSLTREKRTNPMTVFPCYKPICDGYFLTYVRAA